MTQLKASAAQSWEGIDPSLDRLRVAKFRFYFEAEGDLSLPESIHSRFRGVLGHALKRATCTMGNRSCNGCLRVPACPYTFLFDTARRTWPTGDDRYRSPSPPFVLVPLHAGEAVECPSGAVLACDLTLFGSAIRQFRHFYTAFAHFDEWQFGPGGGSARLVRIDSLSADALTAPSSTTLFRDGRWLSNQVTLLSGGDLAKSVDSAGSDAVEIRFLTPVRLKEEGRLLRREGPLFSTWVLRLIERMENLLRFYHGISVQLGGDFLTKAREVRLEAADLRWVDLERYSNRQRTHMKLGGLLGTLTYRGDLAPFLPLLQAGQWTHIGKQTAFGLGKYRVGDGRVPDKRNPHHDGEEQARQMPKG